MRERGFSLVELSVVILIIGIVMTMGIGAWTANLENQALAATAQRQTAIRDALAGYLRRNGRLPCPDNDFTAPDGIENRTTANDPTTACATRFGILPYVTLGLARDAVRDGWGNFFSYHVSNNANAPAASGNWSDNRDWTTSANFRPGNTGTLTLNDRNGVTVTPLATNVVAVIVSHGRNGFGAYSIGGTRSTLPAAGTDELDNTNGTADTTYFRRDATTSDAAAGGAFDDQVMSLTANDLLEPLFRDGSLRAPAAAANDSLQRIKLAVIGHAMGNPNSHGDSNCTSPAATPKCRLVIPADTADGTFEAGNTNGLLPYLDLGLTQAEALDPWGMRYRYQLNATVISTGAGGGIGSNSPAASTVAMTIFSQGPDRADGGGDDISITVTVAELRAHMGSLLP
jgi:prepilin-type N-terminal cleavage/methylation domain-containing protein